MAATWDIESGMGRALSLVQLICKKVRQLGGTQDKVDRLVKEEGEPTLDQIARLIVGTKEKAKLLEFVAAVSLAGIDRFVTSDCFRVGETEDVSIDWLGDNFKEHFLDKVEEGIGAAELKIYKLLQSSRDPAITTELGENSEITLGQFFALLRKQGKGEPGPLLVNGLANIAYIRDQDGVLWAVNADWRDDGWYVNADSVGDPHRWFDGDQVCSR